MKKIVLLLLMIVTISANAQICFKETKIGGSLQCSEQFKTKNYVNLGFNFTVTERITEWSRLRAIAGVNGVILNGFDRYGYTMIGATIEFLPYYIYTDYGLSFNPSGEKLIGFSFDVGLGFEFEIYRDISLYSELGIDRINSGKLWQSTPSVKFGILYKL